jgi:predicted Zn-dependent protease
MRKLGDNQGARGAYINAYKNHKGDKSGIASEVANFLFETGDLKAALSVYSQVIDSLEKSNKNDLLLAAALNNYAWLGIQSEKSDRKPFVIAAKKAVDLFPQNLEIIDTYAKALLKNKDYKGCIKMLLQKEFLNKEPKLLVYLGEAYEKTGDRNKAVRAYVSALNLSEKTGTFSLQINRDLINEHVTVLKSEK